MSLQRRSSDLGAGLSLAKPEVGLHPAGPSKHGPMGQAERAFSAASTFLSGVLAISASQFIGAPLKLVDPKFYDQYMAWTKESFAVLMGTMTQLWAPTVVRVTGDDSMKEQLFQMPDAYTNKMHGRIYIILKESLKNVPIFGWSAQFYNFIFLARKWETDKPRFRRHLDQLGNPMDPMWLLIFPEGTNLSSGTREKSKAWAKKTGVPDMKHQLLPRSTGLQFCLQELKKSTNWLYDCTIAYEGVPEGQFGQDIYTLRSSIFEGRPPKSVNMYWRRWRISELPVDDDDAFSMWLRNRWTEKDYLLEHFFRHGTFPAGDPVKAMKADAAVRKFAAQQKKSGAPNTTITATPKSAKFITTEVKAGGMEEFMGIFSPIATAATAISSGQLSPDNIDFEALMAKVAAQQKASLSGKKVPAPVVPPGPEQAIASPPSPVAPRRPTNGPSSASKVTEGKQLDPEVRRVIESLHAKTQRRLEKAATPSARKVPDLRNTIPMTPMETIITRPISTLALQHGAGALAKLGPKIGEGRKAVERSAATAAAKPKANGVNASATKRPVPQRRMSNQSSTSGSSVSTRANSVVGSKPKPTTTAGVKTVSTVSTNSSVKKPHPLAGKTISRSGFEKSQGTTTGAGAEKSHPLAGKTISRAAFEKSQVAKSSGHTPIGQKKIPKT
ncbi:hypothetical protein ANO11243_036030 [Dothideomycetidae sp. 11243]|nr:hypothetical protein ANO11243_036030 [fungal sp. No.11243]